MKIDFRFSIAIVALFFAPLIPVLAQDKGEAAFKQICAACHTIGKGRLVGPDLNNITLKRSPQWLLDFTRSSQTVIKAGNKDAIAIFEEYNKLIMPDALLSDAAIKEVHAYIANQSSGAAAPAVLPGIPGNAENGKNLFAGLTQQQNRGPTCGSCHNVNSKDFLSGGTLARDLTDSYSRLKEAGLKAMISNSPFPVMQQAYKGKPITEQEVADIVAFLRLADEEKKYQHDRNYGVIMLGGGIFGASILMLTFYLLWWNRRKRTVNHLIFERQKW